MCHGQSKLRNGGRLRGCIALGLSVSIFGLGLVSLGEKGVGLPSERYLSAMVLESAPP